MAGEEPEGDVGAGRGRVEFVSDDGVVVLLLLDGRRCTAVVPPKSVPLVRRLAGVNCELDLELP